MNTLSHQRGHPNFVETLAYMIDSKTVKLVKAVTDYGNLSKAATHLNLTPSAVSHQLKKAETEIGLPLFKRNNRGLTITEAGQAIYDYSLAVVEEDTLLQSKLAAYQKKHDEAYVHGYSLFESNRLNDQANSIADFIHYDSTWEADSTILEIGCGVGAQTKIIAAKNPDCQFVSIDISETSILAARSDEQLRKLTNVEFHCLDAFNLHQLDKQFDHLFICFVLEHLPNPVELLNQVSRFLKAGGTITLVEGDHGSTYFYPETEAAVRAVNAQVAYQQRNGGNANIGRQLYPLLSGSGFTNIQVSPRCIYVDDRNPKLKENFILKTFTAMIEGMRAGVVGAGVETAAVMEAGVADLKRTNGRGGTFNYTFFKGVGRKDNAS